MDKIDQIREIIKEEIRNYFEKHSYSLEDELIMENEIWLGELLDPNNAYPYEGSKGYFKYKDMSDVGFFVRLTYQPESDPYFELKTGWFNEKGEAKYDPSTGPTVNKNSTAKDWDKRSNTVAKIYRDELLPFFEKQNLTNKIIIKPISDSRTKFTERLIKKFTPTGKFDIKYGSPTIIIKK